MAADRRPSAIRQSRFVDEPASSDGDVSRYRQTDIVVLSQNTPENRTESSEGKKTEQLGLLPTAAPRPLILPRENRGEPRPPIPTSRDPRPETPSPAALPRDRQSIKALPDALRSTNPPSVEGLWPGGITGREEREGKGHQGCPSGCWVRGGGCRLGQ